MKIAVIGYGNMGKLVHRLAEEKGHEVVLVTRELDNLSGCDAAIDFTVASAVRGNVEACVAAGVPLVEGTTGWDGERKEIERIVRDGDGAFVYAANFSIGVNLFYKISAYAAELISKFPEYEAFITEQHHSRKKDAPSGTALKLKSVVSEFVDPGEIAATRAGNIPGTHTIGFDGPADQITLTHTARSREGFAHGAITAAEWIAGKKGFYEFSDVLVTES
jgi:4-hydroxy-tetrahydrodipicolinate reductase